MLLPAPKPCALQIASAAERQSGAPFGAVGQVARSAITRVPGMRATAPAVSRVMVVAASAAPLAALPAASVASLAASVAPLKPEFQLPTELSMKWPNASMNPPPPKLRWGG